MIFNKYLLIYFLILLSIIPLTYCVRYQDPIGNSFTPQTPPPSTNSIDLSHEKSETNSDEEIDESNEDQNSYQTSAEVKRLYEKQQEIFSKKMAVKNNVKNVHLSSTTPKISTEASCSSSACLVRKDIEAANTESIRKHILMKLGMDESKLNKTNYPKLNEKLLESLCKRINIKPEHCLGRKMTNVEYQSDDPVDSVYDDFDESEELRDEEENIQFLSYENRIYAFPSTVIKPRHKSHLVFQFTESQKINNLVALATLNIFVHSKSYLKSTDNQITKNLQLIDIEIGKVLHNSPHKRVFETFRNISVPDSVDGEYLQFNITELVAGWFLSDETSHVMAVKIMDSKTGETLPHKVLSLETDKLMTRPFIDIVPQDQRKKRTKRSTLRCAKGSNENRCCRHELTVDFDKFGWDWIIAPKKYDANYCSGECKIAFMQEYAHTHVMQLSTAANPCCSPRKMTAMQLLYFDSQLNIVLVTVPNMIVEECFCS